MPLKDNISISFASLLCGYVNVKEIDYMFATWILCLFLVMIAPYLLIEASVLRTSKCAALGAGREAIALSCRVLLKTRGTTRRRSAACAT